MGAAAVGVVASIAKAGAAAVSTRTGLAPDITLDPADTLTAAIIQTALGDLETAGGGWLHIKAGSVDLGTSTLTIPNVPIKMTGAGWFTVLDQDHTAPHTSAIIDFPAGYTSNFHMSYLKFTSTGNPDTAWRGFLFDTIGANISEKIHFDCIHFATTNGNGTTVIFESQATVERNFWLTNSKFSGQTGNGACVSLSCKNAWILNNVVAGGIQARGTAIIIAGNRIIPGGNTPIINIAPLSTSNEGCHVVNNTLDTGNISSSGDIRFAVISGNALVNGGGIALATIRLSTISGNTIDSPLIDGISIALGDRITMTGNFVEDGAVRGYDLRLAWSTFTGNTSFASASDGLFLTTTTESTVTGNAMVDNGGTGIIESGATDNNIIVGNRVEGNTTAEITVVGAGTVVGPNSIAA